MPCVNVANCYADAVTSTVFHPLGSVVATCCGQRPYPFGKLLDDRDDLREGDEPRESSVKVWDMPQEP